MNLTKQSIVKQLCHELIRWKALNLRPEAILGSLDLQQAYELYKNLLASSDINTAGELDQLHAYTYLRSPQSEFMKHFGVFKPNDPKPVLPRNPYFCATSLFRETITTNTLLPEYDNDAQIALIDRNKNFVYSSVKDHLNGVSTAAESGNKEMVSFLLRPEFSMFSLVDEYKRLLDNCLVTDSQVRQAIFHACGKRFVPKMMDELIQKMSTVNEWIALYQALPEEQQRQLLNASTTPLWSRLNPEDGQIEQILSFIPKEMIAPFFITLLPIISNVTDGRLVLRLLDRMPQAERQDVVLRLGARSNTLFSDPIDLAGCLAAIGYSVTNDHRDLVLDHVHSSVLALLPVVHELNQKVWESKLENHMKLQYFHMIRQLLLATPNERREKTRDYEHCIKACESQLRDQADAHLNWFWLVLNVLGRFFGFISDFPITIQARTLLNGVNDAVINNPTFQVLIFDLSAVILPSEAPESLRRKHAIAALTRSMYSEFWETMCHEERVSLFIDQDRFQKLLRTVGDAKVISLMRGLSLSMKDALLDSNHPASLLSLLHMPLLSMHILFHCLGDDRKNRLLTDPNWFGEMMSHLPDDKYINECVGLMDVALVEFTQNSLPHIQSALVKAHPDRFDFIRKYFLASIPLNKTPQEIGELIEAMSIEKLIPFWTIFLPGRAITVSEMAQLLPVVKDAGKRRALVTHWMTPPSPITVCADDLCILFPEMTPAQQVDILSVISNDDLRRLSQERKIEEILSRLASENHLAFLDRYRTVFAEVGELNLFLDQLHPESSGLLLSKPPFDFLRQLGQGSLLKLIRGFRDRNNEQWEVFALRLLNIAEDIYPSEDPVVTLLKQHVPLQDHQHMLDLLRKSSDHESDGLFDQYLNTNIVQALMRHNRLDFKRITLEAIQDIMEPPQSRERKPRLIHESDECYDQLIQSHLDELCQQVDHLYLSISVTDVGLLALMVPQSGLFYYSFSREAMAAITEKWADITRQIQHMIQHHAELVRLCSVRYYDEAMLQLKPIHKKLSDLVTSHMAPFSQKQQYPIERTGLKVTYFEPDIDAVVALKRVEETLLTINEREEARLLQAMSDVAIIDKMKTGKVFKKFYELIVTPINRTQFLGRCRELVDAALWQKLSPSSLGLLSSNAPKAFFKIVGDEDFMSLVRTFSLLSQEQWDALGPNLFDLRQRYFSKDDKLVTLLRDNVQVHAYFHVLNLIRITSEEELDRLFHYLTSDVVREYKKDNQTDDSMITIADLSRLEQSAESWFDDHVRRRERVLRDSIDRLDLSLISLQKELNPQEEARNFLGKMFYAKYTFNSLRINELFEGLAHILDTMNQSKKDLNRLSRMKTEAMTPNFMQEQDARISAMKRRLENFIHSEGWEEKRPHAPQSVYCNGNTLDITVCLDSLCRDLNTASNCSPVAYVPRLVRGIQ